MNAKVQAWHLVAIAVGVGGGLWLLLPPGPPDFTGRGFTEVHVHLRGQSPEALAERRDIEGVVPRVNASSTDPALVAELAEVLRSGQSVTVCRCGVLGTIEFRRPDGTFERVLVMPAHREGAFEFRVLDRGRFRVSREWFLRVVEPLGIPAARWYE